MKKIEVYDIITLNNRDEYVVLKKDERNNHKYYVLSLVDKTEEPDFDNLTIVEEIIKGDDILIEELKDKELISAIAKSFLKDLDQI